MIAAGGILADVSWRGPFFIYILAIPVFILALLFLDEPEVPASIDDKRGAERAPYPWKPALVIGALTLTTSLIYYVEPLNVATVLRTVGVESASMAGIIQALTALLYIFGALAYKRYHHWSVGRLLALAGSFIGLGLIVLGVAESTTAVISGAILQQFGAGMVIPTLLAWVQQMLPFQQRGRGMGIWVTAFFTGTFLCPPVITWLSHMSGGLQPAIVIMGMLAVGLSALAVSVSRRSGSGSSVRKAATHV
jgi:MFS family permease